MSVRCPGSEWAGKKRLLKVLEVDGAGKLPRPVQVGAEVVVGMGTKAGGFVDESR
jgi:hypothetical protein